MELLTDPALLISLLTLVLIEVILGLDNLIFIAIVIEKLPLTQRDQVRIIGLIFALLLRIILLFSMSWLTSLTTPLINIGGRGFSGHNLILIFGGFFLLIKASKELIGHIKGTKYKISENKIYARFWPTMIQVIMLDLIFSIDSVIIAIGMVDNLSIMVIAVIIAVIIMMIASKALTIFINAHPTIIALCLGFLLLIGCSLIAEGIELYIPKGYIYSSMGFSMLIELFNQLTNRNRKIIEENIKTLASK